MIRDRVRILYLYFYECTLRVCTKGAGNLKPQYNQWSGNYQTFCHLFISLLLILFVI